MTEEQSVADLLAEFQSNLHKTGITSDWYVIDVRLFLDDAGFGLDTKLKLEDYQNVIDAIDSEVKLMEKSKEFKPSTKNRKKVSIHTFYDFLKNKANVKLPKRYQYEHAEPSIPKILSNDQFNVIIKQIPNTFMGARDSAIFSIIYWRGPSLSNLVKVSYQDILRVEGRIIGLRINTKYKVVEVPLTDIIIGNLEKYENLFKAKKKKPHLNVEGVPYFRNTEGEPLNIRSVRRNFALYVEKAGLEDITFSSLQYSFIQREKAGGVELAKLAEILGVNTDFMKYYKYYKRYFPISS